MDKVKIGLIGAGWIGREHARNIAKNPDAKLVAVCGQDDKEILEIKNETKTDGFSCYSDYQKLLKQKDIDAVLICTPNNFHSEMVIGAAKFGKHIMCEKPMAITLDDCRKIRDTVNKYKVKYLIGYHRRFNPLFQYVKDLLGKGSLGSPYFIESDYIHYVSGNLKIWEWLGKENIAGSIFHAGCGHNIDLMRFFLGEIKEVFCFKDIFHPRKSQVETEDTAIATFRFKNNSIGKSMLSLGAVSPFTFNFGLYGTGGTVRNNKIWLSSIPKFDETNNGKNYIELPEVWIPDNKQGGIAETWNKSIDCFIDIIKNNKPSPNDVDSAYKTSEVCFAVVRSALEKKVIKL
jgi:myo-inositol 2-dehydrogenase/D-chiro-inositol 1-dehydrogenase